MANGCETSLDQLVFDNQGDLSLSLQPIPEKKELTESPPPEDPRFSESSSPIPEKKGWFKKKKKDGNEKKEETYPGVNPVKIFRFASIFELLLMCVGLFAGLIQGGAFPFIFLAIGEVIDSFFKFQTVSSGCSTNFFSNTSSSGITALSRYNTVYTIMLYV